MSDTVPPAEFDPSEPFDPHGILGPANVARVYNYLLGETAHLAHDRAAAARLLRLWPEAPLAMKANRAFMRRAVRVMAGAGVRQFLDLGAGIQTAENVHRVAAEYHDSARVAYVDNDPVVIAHGHQVFRGDERVRPVLADIRDPDAVLTHPDVLLTLDFSQPVGLLMLAVLHFVDDADDPVGLVAAYRSALVPGSFVAISHATADHEPELAERAREAYAESTTRLTLRSRADVFRMLRGCQVLPPGVVLLPLWNPDPGDVAPVECGRLLGIGAVGVVRPDGECDVGAVIRRQPPSSADEQVSPASVANASGSAVPSSADGLARRIDEESL